ncbi:MAG: carboxypeptidase regulatory-like domain-containing protein [Bacteroidetes bacterium]|nr:carboxypeptidase regulatory-like domain-containing protein [Bacteroidota bacterium]
MKQILFLIFFITAMVSCCFIVKPLQISAVNQGISGFVTELKGNQMPMKGADSMPPKGLAAIIYVYEQTNLSQVTKSNKTGIYTAIQTKRLATIQTDSVGAFRIALPVGKYSLFIKSGESYFANDFNQFNNICLIEVEAQKWTTARIVLNSAASY